MDGTPVFNLLDRCLPGVEVQAFRGTLNSTTSLVLAHMYTGYTYMWIPAGWWALSRIVFRRRGWAKTTRTPEDPLIIQDVAA